MFVEDEAGATGGAAGAAGTGGAAGAAGTGGAAGAGGAAAAPWHGQTDPAAVSYVQNKGWQNPGDVIKSYQGAEKLIGRDPNTLLALPKDGDQAAVRGVLGKLGLPESGDKYEFDSIDGVDMDKEYVAWARGTYHRIGLLPGQVKELSKAHAEYVKAATEKQVKDYQLSLHADRQTLLTEWGAGHERMMAAAKHAAQGLGFTAEIIDAIERSVGYANTWKFFGNLGQRMGEDKFVSGDVVDKKFNTGITPAEAAARWEEMKADKTIIESLKNPMHPNHEANKAKQRQLFKIMHPE